MVVFELSTRTVVVELQMTTKLNYWRFLPPEAGEDTLCFMLITPGKFVVFCCIPCHLSFSKIVSCLHIHDSRWIPLASLGRISATSPGVEACSRATEQENCVLRGGWNEWNGWARHYFSCGYALSDKRHNSWPIRGLGGTDLRRFTTGVRLRVSSSLRVERG